jgi:hypothetical protein
MAADKRRESRLGVDDRLYERARFRDARKAFGKAELYHYDCGRRFYEDSDGRDQSSEAVHERESESCWEYHVGTEIADFVEGI